MMDSNIPNTLLTENLEPPSRENVLERFRTGLFKRLETGAQSPEAVEESVEVDDEVSAGDDATEVAGGTESTEADEVSEEPAVEEEVLADEVEGDEVLSEEDDDSDSEESDSEVSDE